MKKPLSFKSRYHLLQAFGLVILIVGVYFGFRAYQSSVNLAGTLELAVTNQEKSKTRLNSLSKENRELVDDVKSTIPENLANNLKQQDSKTQLVKAFDSLVQFYNSQDQISNLNSISIGDSAPYLDGVLSRNISLDLTTTQDSLLGLIQELESSYLANEKAQFFLRIDGLNFNTSSREDESLDVSLTLQLFNLANTITQTDE